MTNDTLFTSRCDTAGGAGGGGLGSNLGFGKMASGSLDNLKPVSLPQVMEVHEPCFLMPTEVMLMLMQYIGISRYQKRRFKEKESNIPQ